MDQQVHTDVPDSTQEPVIPSAARAWCYLVRISWQRQARAHLMVLIALGLLAMTTFAVFMEGRAGRWEGEFGFMRFARGVVLVLLCGFLLPIWSLSFATEALGREREAHNLVWVLTRPLSRPAIYLAKFVAVLPWVLGLNLGGLALICAVAGPTGREAFGLYWPAVLAGSVTYAALFHLMGAWFRRAAVVAVLYSFFLESFLGSMPGYWKRVSITFYTRCLIFDASDGRIQPLNPSTYIPIEGSTALGVLAAATLLFLLWGMRVFNRSEYLDLS
jgi:ABC-type transport system involved in multi-copper enzyme maturation permease subunit